MTLLNMFGGQSVTLPPMDNARKHADRHTEQTMLTSPFTNPLAVEAWDAWFRWREDGQLRDLTIDATWDRVATALATAESGAARADCKRRFMNAFSSWQLLVDERVIATAGTPGASWRSDDLVAVLNVASFVRSPCTQSATFDRTSFEEVAALAVRALDDAITMRLAPTTSATRLRIGVIGLGDALALLGLAYDSGDARAQATLVAQALANGCLAGSIALARDRGPRIQFDGDLQRRARVRENLSELVEDATRCGLRHAELTAITPQQRLAWFANHVADALNPALVRVQAENISARDGKRTVHSQGYALTTIRQVGPAGSGPNILLGAVPARAQLELRAAMQQWIDEPIVYPPITAHVG